MSSTKFIARQLTKHITKHTRPFVESIRIEVNLAPLDKSSTIQARNDTGTLLYSCCWAGFESQEEREDWVDRVLKSIRRMCAVRNMYINFS